jgi:hypothetical protein
MGIFSSTLKVILDNSQSLEFNQGMKSTELANEISLFSHQVSIASFQAVISM